MTANAIAVLGTGSDVGKSLIAAGLCRLFRRAGLRVAPFKAQNMSLNSFVTPEGGEIGRAQALQAEACGLLPHVDMNPILLKPEADNRSQIVVLGKVFGKLEASVYFERRQELWKVVQESYGRLASQYEVMVIEGAGSAAEVNLRDRDLVNWPVAHLADARVVLVADIDRGGVFAQVIGTLELLLPEERERVCGIVINKFRGDQKLFEEGVEFLESRTGVPVLGVVPFLRDLVLDQEDSLDVERTRQAKFLPDRVNIAVILLPHMSNFTDFDHLAAEGDVVLRYIAEPHELDGADVVIIPGTKNTIEDVCYLRDKGLGDAILTKTSEGREIVGICGGYQMLGRSIADPDEVEAGGTAEGFGLLDVTTKLLKNKVTCQIEAEAHHLDSGSACHVQGYYIHMGKTQRSGDKPCFTVRAMGHFEESSVEEDGAVSESGLIWGTYIHGVFERPAFRRVWLNRVRLRKGLTPIAQEVSNLVTGRLSAELDRWADHLETHLRFGHLLESWRCRNTTLNASMDR